MNDINSLKKALKKSPKSVPLLQLYGQSCLDNWLLFESKKAFKQVLSFDSSHKEARLGLAKVLFLEGKLSEAIIHTEQLLKVDDKYIPAHLFLSRVFLNEDSRNLSLEHYKKALEINKHVYDPALEKELGLQSVFSLKKEVFEELKDKHKTTLRLRGDDEEEISEDDIQFDSDDNDDFSSLDLSMEDFEFAPYQFSDFGGANHIKELILLKMYYPTKFHELFSSYNKERGGSLFLYGPSGCGKTFIAQSTSGELAIPIIHLGFHQIMDMFSGNSEKNLHQVFELAKNNPPCIILIDSIDLFLSQSSNSLHISTAGNNLFYQVLMELDRLKPKAEILIIATSNTPWNIDPSIWRAGRFDSSLFLGPPNLKERKEIIEIYSKKKPIVDLDVSLLAKKTKNFSGAEIESIFERAIEKKLAKSIFSGSDESQFIPLDMDVLLKSASEIMPIAPQWFQNAKKHNFNY